MVTLESASLASVTTDSIAVLTQTRKASSVFGKHCTTVHLVNNFATLISTVIGSVAELTPCNLPLLRGSSTLRAVLRDGSDISRILLLEHAWVDAHHSSSSPSHFYLEGIHCSDCSMLLLR